MIFIIGKEKGKFYLIYYKFLVLNYCPNSLHCMHWYRFLNTNLFTETRLLFQQDLKTLSFIRQLWSVKEKCKPYINEKYYIISFQVYKQ